MSEVPNGNHVALTGTSYATRVVQHRGQRTLMRYKGSNVVRVLLADDQSTVRSALQLLLEEDPRLDVVGEATEAEELLAQVEVTSPDLVLLDWELPGSQAADLLFALHQHYPHLAVIALSGRPEAGRAALAAGADAFVSKGDPPERLLAVLSNCCRI